MRGHGHSPYAPARSLADYADDVHALLEKLSFAPCAVTGFAMGGMVAQALAVRYPGDVQAAVFANINHQQTKESFAVLMGRAKDARDRGMAPILDTRSEEHTSELQSRFGISYAVFCLKKQT